MPTTARIHALSLRLDKATDHADVLTRAIERSTFVAEGLFFRDTGERENDHLVADRRSLVFQLMGTSKLYRVMIEPIRKTHTPG